MLTLTACAPGDPALLRLVGAMTAELIPVYGLPPDAQPAPLAAGSRYVLARRDGRPVGCCAVQPVAPAVCELKRMYVEPGERGTGVARALLARAEQVARALGAERMRLETGTRQPAAVRLYERAGYRRIPKYPPHEGDPTSLCYEKALPEPAAGSGAPRRSTAP
jgi:putative acetyltransferase